MWTTTNYRFSRAHRAFLSSHRITGIMNLRIKILLRRRVTSLVRFHMLKCSDTVPLTYLGLLLNIAESETFWLFGQYWICWRVGFVDEKTRQYCLKSQKVSVSAIRYQTKYCERPRYVKGKVSLHFSIWTQWRMRRRIRILMCKFIIPISIPWLD